MMIFVIIVAAIIVILLCREVILHKGDFFERTIMASPKRGRSEFLEEPTHGDGLSPPPALDGTLPGDPLYPAMHSEE